ncbi:hypothetical protein MPSEU_000625100 [Mayamaea pseudoterrestris]|nr:hypothetical protein MPSEU_000625100 [Mayamaea pseudoterrestris]
MKSFALICLLAAPTAANLQVSDHEPNSKPAAYNLLRMLDVTQPSGSQSFPSISTTTSTSSITNGEQAKTTSDRGFVVFDRNFFNPTPSSAIPIATPAPTIAPSHGMKAFGGTTSSANTPSPSNVGLADSSFVPTNRPDVPSSSSSFVPTKRQDFPSSSFVPTKRQDSPSSISLESISSFVPTKREDYTSSSFVPTKRQDFPSTASSFVPAKRQDFPSSTSLASLSSSVPTKRQDESSTSSSSFVPTKRTKRSANTPAPSTATGFGALGEFEGDAPSVIPISVSLLSSDVPSNMPSISLDDVDSSDAPSDMPSTITFELSGGLSSESASGVPTILSSAPSDMPSYGIRKAGLATSDVPSDQPSLSPNMLAASDMPSFGFGEKGLEVVSGAPSIMLAFTSSDVPSDSPSQAPTLKVATEQSDMPPIGYGENGVEALDAHSDAPSIIALSDVPSNVPSDMPSLAPFVVSDATFALQDDFERDNFYSCSGYVDSLNSSSVAELTVDYEYRLVLDESQTNQDSDIDALVESIERMVLEAAMSSTCDSELSDRRLLQESSYMAASAAPEDVPYRSCGTYCYHMKGAMVYRMSDNDTKGIASVYCSALEAIALLFKSETLSTLPHVKSAVFTTDGESTMCNLNATPGGVASSEPMSASTETVSTSGFGSPQSFFIIGAFGIATAFLIIGGVVLNKTRLAQAEEDDEHDKAMAIHTLSTDEESGNANDTTAEYGSIYRRDSASASYDSKGLLRSWERTGEKESAPRVLGNSSSWEAAATLGFTDIDLDEDSGYDDDYFLQEESLNK